MFRLKGRQNIMTYFKSELSVSFQINLIENSINSYWCMKSQKNMLFHMNLCYFKNIAIDVCIALVCVP